MDKPDITETIHTLCSLKPSSTRLESIRQEINLAAGVLTDDILPGFHSLQQHFQEKCTDLEKLPSSLQDFHEQFQSLLAKKDRRDIAALINDDVDLTVSTITATIQGDWHDDKHGGDWSREEENWLVVSSAINKQTGETILFSDNTIRAQHQNGRSAARLEKFPKHCRECFDGKSYEGSLRNAVANLAAKKGNADLLPDWEAGLTEARRLRAVDSLLAESTRLETIGKQLLSLQPAILALRYLLHLFPYDVGEEWKFVEESFDCREVKEVLANFLQNCPSSRDDALKMLEGKDELKWNAFCDMAYTSDLSVFAPPALLQRAQALLEKIEGLLPDITTLLAKEAAGEIRLNFGNHYDANDAYVIRPDGSLRLADNDPGSEEYKNLPESEKSYMENPGILAKRKPEPYWRVVDPRELALYLRKPKHVIRGEEPMIIDFVPKTGVTDAQYAALRGIYDKKCAEYLKATCIEQTQLRPADNTKDLRRYDDDIQAFQELLREGRGENSVISGNSTESVSDNKDGAGLPQRSQIPDRVLPSVEEMSEDEQLAEFELVTGEEDKIRAAHPDIDSAFDDLDNAQRALQICQTEIADIKRTRDAAGGDTKKRNHAKTLLEQKDGERKKLQDSIGRLTNRTQVLRKPKKRLDELLVQKGKIEAKLQ